MSERWASRLQEEIKVLQGSQGSSANESGDENALPYFVVMKEYNLVVNKGICTVSFIVSLDDDVGNDGNKIILQRAASSRIIVFLVDASIKLRPGTSIQEPSMSYPFFEPEITLTYGAGYFPSSSDINVSNGDRLKLDQWETSFHLRDAAVSIATLLRRSIRSGNLCLKVEKKEENDENSVETASSASSSGSSGGGLLGKIKRLKELRGLLKKAEADADTNAGDSKPEHTESREARKIKKLRELRASKTKSVGVASNEDLGGEASLMEVLTAIAEPENNVDSEPIPSQSTELVERRSKDEGLERKVASMAKAFEDVFKKSSSSNGDGNEEKDYGKGQSAEVLVEKTSDEDRVIYDTITESVDEILSVISEGDEEDEEEIKYKEEERFSEQMNGNENDFEEDVSNVQDDMAIQASIPQTQEVSSKRIQSLKEIYEGPKESLHEQLDESNPPNRGDTETLAQRNEECNKLAGDVDADGKSKTSSLVSRGDVINLDQHPYNQACGLYSCEVVRRPEFIESEVAAEDIVEKELRRRSSGIFQEHFVMITEEQIIEIKRPSNESLWGERAKIVFMLPIISLLRIRFLSEKGSILLYFREGRSEALEYIIPDCAKVAKVIQSILEKNGFHGRHRSAAMEKARKVGLELCKKITLKQSRLDRNPSFEQIQEIIDLHCLAAEKLEYARDDRYTEIVSHMNRFLSKPKIAHVLSCTSDVQVSALMKIKLSIESMAALSDISSVTSNTQSLGSRSLDDQSGQISLNESSDYGEQGDAISENDPSSEYFENVGDRTPFHKGPLRILSRISERNSKTQNERIPFQRRIVI